MIKKVHMAGRILIASFFITGTILAYADKIKSHIRQSFIDEALSYSRAEIIKGNQEITCSVPAPSILSITGEDYVDDQTDYGSYGQAEAGLHLAAILDIPEIELEEPVWKECDSVAMRYGVVLWKTSVNPGEAGNCIIIGHRNRHTSTCFYRLQELVAGEQVVLMLKDGTERIYEVYETVTCPPSHIPGYLEQGTGESLTLITCATEYGKGWRFIAVCHPISDD